MHFEAALNSVWVLLGLLALASTIRATYRRNGREKQSPAWLHIVGVALIVLALFPYISATDDVLRIQHFSQQQDQNNPSRQSQTDNLMRLYQAMDSPLVCRISQIVLTFFFVSVVFRPAARLTVRIAPFEAGRSPPTAAAI